MSGQPADCLVLIQEGIALLNHIGASMDRPYLLALQSEICAANGQVPEALALVAEALGQVRGSRTYFYEAELLPPTRRPGSSGQRGFEQMMRRRMLIFALLACMGVLLVRYRSPIRVKTRQQELTVQLQWKIALALAKSLRLPLVRCQLTPLSCLICMQCNRLEAWFATRIRPKEATQ